MAAKTFTLAECKQHTSEKSCWLVIHGKVYDVSPFLEEHPGGFDIILASAGAWRRAMGGAAAGGWRRGCAAMTAGRCRPPPAAAGRNSTASRRPAAARAAGGGAQLGPRRESGGGGRRRAAAAGAALAAACARSPRRPPTQIPLLPAIAPTHPHTPRAGKDSTQDFEEIGHSGAARKQLDQFLIGSFEGGDSAPVSAAPAKTATRKAAGPDGLSRVFRLLLPLLLILVAVYLSKSGGGGGKK